jgi:hypothetical protein
MAHYLEQSEAVIKHKARTNRDSLDSEPQITQMGTDEKTENEAAS